MGVYRKVGEANGEDRYRQLDSRRSGHVLHLQVKRSSLETATDRFQWQIEKPCSKDHNGEMRKRVDPTDTSLFSHSNTSFLSPLFSNWMFKAEYVYGKMIADEDCKVVKFSPFLHEQCNRITIKTPYLESGGGKWKNAIHIYRLYITNFLFRRLFAHFRVQCRKDGVHTHWDTSTPFSLC